MHTVTDQMQWAFAGVSHGSHDFALDGVDVFAHPWVPAVDGNGERAEVTVTDPQHGQTFRFPVYRILVGGGPGGSVEGGGQGGREIVFAAGEFSNNVWGFYRPAPAPPITLPAPAPGRPGWRRLAPFVPLAAAAFEVPWVVLVIMSQIGGPGRQGDDPTWARRMTFLAVLPAIVGLTYGAYLIARGRVGGGTGTWAALLVGCALCGLILLGLGGPIFR